MEKKFNLVNQDDTIEKSNASLSNLRWFELVSKLIQFNRNKVVFLMLMIRTPDLTKFDYRK